MAKVSGNMANEEALLLDRETPERLGRLGVQTWWLRPIAFFVACVVMVGFAFLEWNIRIYAMNPYSELSSLFFVWAVSPIIAITAITMTLLIGVFRGIRGNELDGMNNPFFKAFGNMAGE